MEQQAQVVPYDKETEEALIGACVTNSTLIEGLRATIAPEDFFIQQNASVWRAMLEMDGRGDAVDIVTLTQAGFNPAEITRAMSVGSTVNVETYARIVKEFSTRRRAITLASHLARKAYDRDTPIGETVAEIASDLEKIEAGQEQLVTEGMRAASNLWDALEAMSNGVPLGLQTPWNELNDLIGGLVAPELICLAARPSMGKTQMALQITDNIVRSEGKVLYHDMETDKQAIVRRIALSRSGVDWMKFRNGTQTPSDIASLSTEVARIMGEQGLYIVDKRMRIEQFYWLARSLSRRVGGLDLVVVDYLQLYPTSGINRVVEIGEVAEMLKDLAKELRCAVIATCQLRRLQDRLDKTPTLEDLRESGRIEQAADLVLALHRPSYYNPTANSDGSGPTQVHVLKARDGVRGTHTTLHWASAELRFKGVQSQSGRTLGRPRTTQAARPPVQKTMALPSQEKVDDGLRVAGTEGVSGVRGSGPPDKRQVPPGRGEVQRRDPDGVEAVQDNGEDAERGRDRGGGTGEVREDAQTGGE